MLYGYSGPAPMIRDGWVLIQRGKSLIQPAKARLRYVIDPPTIYRRANPCRGALTLERREIGAGVTNGPGELLEFAVLSGSDSGEKRRREQLASDEHELEREELGRLDWADWGPNGDLLFAREGELFHARLDTGKDHLAEPMLVMDFRPLTFTEVPPTDDALKIPQQRGRWRKQQ